MGFDSAHAWPELFKISEFLQASADLPSTTPVAAERKQASRTLTSNQIFLGIISSPWAVHMIQTPAKMSRELTMDVSEIEKNLLSSFNYRLSVRDLGFHIYMIAPTIDVLHP
jgi:hypothetical protein